MWFPARLAQGQDGLPELWLRNYLLRGLAKNPSNAYHRISGAEPWYSPEEIMECITAVCSLMAQLVLGRRIRIISNAGGIPPVNSCSTEHRLHRPGVGGV
jgi:hypothetical protein